MRCSKCGYNQLPTNTCRSCGVPLGTSKITEEHQDRAAVPTSNPETDLRPLLNPVGLALIIVGTFSLFMNGFSYFWTICIFLIITGIFLIRGNLVAARIVAWFSAAAICCLLSTLFLFPFLVSPERLLPKLRLHPAIFLKGFLQAAVFLLFFRWTYRRLTKPVLAAAIQMACKYSNSFWSRPVSGFIAGSVLSVLLLMAFESPVISRDMSSNSILDISPNQMRSYLKEAYLLKPDNRFLGAVSDIHHFLTGQPKENTSYHFENGHWLIRYKNAEVGILPELPNYSDFKKILVRWVKTLQEQHPVLLSSEQSPDEKELSQELDKVLSAYVVKSLRKIDTDWEKGKHLQSYLPLATRGMVLLSVQDFDAVETADALFSKTWSLLTITQTLTPFQMVREESLFSYALGYTGTAYKLATTLAPDDPIRLFVSNDKKALCGLAQQNEDMIEAKFLALVKISKTGTINEWIEWVQKYFDRDRLSLPIILTGLNLNSFETESEISAILPGLVLIQMYYDENLPQQSGQITKLSFESKNNKEQYFGQITELILYYVNSKVSHVELAFDILTKSKGGNISGPFLDKASYEAYYRSYFYSSLYTLGMYYMDSLSSIEAVNSFNARLERLSSTMAIDFKQWYEHLAEFKRGKADLNLLIEDINSLPTFGAAPLEKTFEILKEEGGYGYPELDIGVKGMARRMDSRISHRIEMGDLAFGTLQDLYLTDILYKSIIEATYPLGQSNIAWYANLSGDSKQLLAIVQDTNANWDDRVYALEFLIKQKGTSNVVIGEEFEKLIAVNPSEWIIYSKYITFLEGIEDYKKGEEIINTWIGSHSNSDFNMIFAKTALARLYYKEGQFELGLKTVAPFVESYQAGAMERAALLLDKLGRIEKSETLMKMASERYPDSFRTASLMAELYWKHRKYDEAAKFLTSIPKSIPSTSWAFEISEHFKNVFANEPREKAEKAIEALSQAGISPWNLITLARPIAKAGNYELAFEIASKIKNNASTLGDVEFLTEGYQYLKAWKGEESALNWLRSGIPGPFVNPSSMIFFEQKQYDLLWTLIKLPKGEGADFIWLLRAAAYVKSKDKLESRKSELIQYYSSRNSGLIGSSYIEPIARFCRWFRFQNCSSNITSYYDRIGMYLMGITNEREALELASSEKQKCEVTFYLGLKADAEGRFEDATDWYRASVETGFVENGEYRWAYNRLYEWYSSGKSLSLIKEEANENRI
jgi:hypothetical protein